MWESVVKGFMDPGYRAAPWTVLVPLGMGGLSLLTFCWAVAGRALLRFVDPSARSDEGGGARRAVRVGRRLASWAGTLALGGALIFFATAYYEASRRLAAGELGVAAMARGATGALFTVFVGVGASVLMLVRLDLSAAAAWFAGWSRGGR